MTIADDLTTVIGEVEEAQSTLASNFAQPATDDTRLDSAKTIPDSYQSLSHLDSELTTILQSIKGIAEQSDLALVPLKYLNSTLDHLRQILQHYSAANSALTASRPIQSI